MNIRPWLLGGALALTALLATTVYAEGEEREEPAPAVLELFDVRDLFEVSGVDLLGEARATPGVASVTLREGGTLVVRGSKAAMLRLATRLEALRSSKTGDADGAASGARKRLADLQRSLEITRAALERARELRRLKTAQLERARGEEKLEEVRRLEAELAESEERIGAAEEQLEMLEKAGAATPPLLLDVPVVDPLSGRGGPLARRTVRARIEKRLEQVRSLRTRLERLRATEESETRTSEIESLQTAVAKLEGEIGLLEALESKVGEWPLASSPLERRRMAAVVRALVRAQLARRSKGHPPLPGGGGEAGAPDSSGLARWGLSPAWQRAIELRRELENYRIALRLLGPREQEPVQRRIAELETELSKVHTTPQEDPTDARILEAVRSLTQEVRSLRGEVEGLKALVERVANQR